MRWMYPEKKIREGKYCITAQRIKTGKKIFCPGREAMVNIPACLTQSGRVASPSCTEYHPIAIGWGTLIAF